MKGKRLTPEDGESEVAAIRTRLQSHYGHPGDERTEQQLLNWYGFAAEIMRLPRTTAIDRVCLWVMDDDAFRRHP
jgi:hypothetical protein